LEDASANPDSRSDSGSDTQPDRIPMPRKRRWRVGLIGALCGMLACLVVNVGAAALLPIWFAPGRDDGKGGYAPIICSFYCGMPVMALIGMSWALVRRRQG
jgi:hypothetical protein